MAEPSQRLRNSITKDNLWLYILSLLKRREGYPYEIREMIEKRFGFKPGKVTAYIVLKKLEKGGYVSKTRKVKREGPERTYYRITGKGLGEIDKGKEILERTCKTF
jgi:DNA-binding PadR family transcriptional regulator